MTSEDFKRWTVSIKAKIQLLIGKCILKAINDSEGNQKIQVSALKGETISEMERFQEYGLTTYPKNDAEVLAVFQNGNRDQGIAICVNDRTYRPKTLSEGEVMLYDHAGTQIYLKTGNKVEVNGQGEILLNTGDASKWKPNIISIDPFSGAPHGGPVAGIEKLKGA